MSQRLTDPGDSWIVADAPESSLRPRWIIAGSCRPFRVGQTSATEPEPVQKPPTRAEMLDKLMGRLGESDRTG